MKIVNYSLLCEDVAHETFIKDLLPHFINISGLEINLGFNKDFFYKYKCRNSKDVLKRYVKASIDAIDRFEIDLLLIGIDYDDRDRGRFSNEIEKLYSGIVQKVREKSVIFFPVQAIEHWLLLIQYRYQNPNSTKNVSNDFEKIQRKNAKIDLYGARRPLKETQRKIVSEMVNQINIDWLKTRSQSFNRFYSDLNGFFTQSN
ncbi:MAG: hypothetical protein GXO89_08900 [Chlorobi bacterium]|nr:hypothetical protein [Chlorobiota bacterium]